MVAQQPSPGKKCARSAKITAKRAKFKAREVRVCQRDELRPFSYFGFHPFFSRFLPLSTRPFLITLMRKKEMQNKTFLTLGQRKKIIARRTLFEKLSKRFFSVRQIVARTFLNFWAAKADVFEKNFFSADLK